MSDKKGIRNGVVTKAPRMEKQKNKCIAYFLWLIGGIWGWHHFYLRRDRQAFVWWTTLGGGFLGWFRDSYRIPQYVQEANETEEYMTELKNTILKHPKPPFSSARFIGSWYVGYLWSLAVVAAVPEEPIFGITFTWLSQFIVPLASAVGVHTVGSIGKQTGSLKYMIYCSAIMVLNRDVSTQCLWSAFLAATSLRYTARWKETTRPHFCKRVTTLFFCGLFYTSLWGSCLYFNASLTDQNGEKIKLRDAFHNFLRSPFFQQFLRTFAELRKQAATQGWWHIYKDFVAALDPYGEKHAAEVLELPDDYTQDQVKSNYKKLVLKWHPDHYQIEEDKAIAHEKFVSIQEAYDILSRSHRKHA